MADLVGHVLAGRYRVDAFIGRGGMAEVYKVWDSKRMTFLAMKLLHDDLAIDRIFMRRFQREAQTLAKLQHPSIVRFYELVQEGRLAFILLDYIDGGTLKHKIFDAGGPMPMEEICRVFGSICSALAFAHSDGLIHCDIKPANIMFHLNGGVLLSDFGIARMSDAATATMVGMGTPAYMAPEQIRGQDPTIQTDIYALGIVLFEMLTGGERPFTGESARTTGSTGEKVRWEQLHLQPPSPRNWNSKISPEIESIVLRCLAKEPGDRFVTTLDLLNALLAASGEAVDESPITQSQVEIPQKEPPAVPSSQPVLAEQSTTPKRITKWMPWAAGLIIIALIIIIIMLVFYPSNKMVGDIPDIPSTLSASPLLPASTEETALITEKTPSFTLTSTEVILPTTTIPLLPSTSTQIIETIDIEENTRGTSGTITILYWQAASTMNAYLSGGTKDIDASSIVLEPLARYDETGNMVPWLAEEIPTIQNGGVSADLKSITWKLKKDVVWSDGTPFKAEDVVFTGKYCIDPDMGCNAKSLFEDVVNFEALDDLTVKITFWRPKPFPYGPFVGATVPIIQKAQFENCMGAAAQECTEQNFYPVGTGPYTVKEFRANDTVLLEANELFRDPNKPFFQEVVFKGGGDAASAGRAVLETGEADYAWNLQVEPEILRAMEASGQGQVLTGFRNAVERLIVNFTNNDPVLGDNRSLWIDDDGDGVNDNPHPFLSDYNVRCALSLAIDRTAIVETGYGYAGIPACNIVAGPEIYRSTENDGCLAQNITEANRLLDEAGWVLASDGVREKDGVRLSILYQTSTNSVRQGTQALIKQMWSAIGVETKLRNIDAAVFFGGDPASPDTYGKFYADIEMYTNTFDGTDTEAYMNNWRCEEVSGPDNQWLGNNVPRWCVNGNKEFTALLAELKVTADLIRRGEIVQLLNDMIIQNYVIIPLVARGDVSAIHNTLLGVRFNVWDSEMWNIEDWSRAD